MPETTRDTFDMDKLADFLSDLVDVTIPERGTEDELRLALRDLSRAGIQLTKKYLELKPMETRLKIALSNANGAFKTQRAVQISNPTEAYAACKNDKAREAYIESVLTDELEAIEKADGRVRQMGALLEMVSESVSRLKFLKENVSRQVDILQMEAALAPRD